MVLYYSATGNTEFIAKELAKRLNDECVDLLPRVKAQDFSPLHSEKPFLICAPVYVCEIPRFLTAYLKKQTFTGSREVYGIFTSGGYCGPAGLFVKNIFKKKRMAYHGHAEFTMPRNYVASDAYSMLEDDEIEARICGSVSRLDAVADDIRAGNKLKARHVFLFETLITLPLNPFWCKYKLTSKAFFAKDTCIGCKKCETLCPLNNIRIADGKPVWGDTCTHCMACIGNCPTDAIEYGTITQGKPRYRFEKYRSIAEDSSK